MFLIGDAAPGRRRLACVQRSECCCAESRATGVSPCRQLQQPESCTQLKAGDRPGSLFCGALFSETEMNFREAPKLSNIKLSKLKPQAFNLEHQTSNLKPSTPQKLHFPLKNAYVPFPPSSSGLSLKKLWIFRSTVKS